MQVGNCSCSGSKLSWPPSKNNSSTTAIHGLQHRIRAIAAATAEASARTRSVCRPGGLSSCRSRYLLVSRAAANDGTEQAPAGSGRSQQPSSNATAVHSTDTMQQPEAAQITGAEASQGPRYSLKDLENATMRSLHELDETPILPSAGRAHPVVPGLHFTSDSATLDLVGEGLPVIQGVSLLHRVQRACL